jgi:hypothetical protein
MDRGRRIKTTFSDGSVAHLTTEKGFTHAWRVTGLMHANKPAEITGWARSEALAQQAAGAHARSVAKHWKNVKRRARRRSTSRAAASPLVGWLGTDEAIRQIRSQLRI